VRDLERDIASGAVSMPPTSSFTASDAGSPGTASAANFAAQLKDPDSKVRSAAAAALGKLGPAGASAAIQVATLLKDPDSRVRGEAAAALGNMGPAVAALAPQLAALLTDDDLGVRNAAARALSQVSAAEGGASASGETDVRPVSTQVLDAVGGVLPRLYIQIYDETQRKGASQLRDALRGVSLGDDPLVVPGVEKVGTDVNGVQLRFLTGDEATQKEAKVLADNISKLLEGTPVSVVDLSKEYGKRPGIRPRTYELWFPSGQSIQVQGRARSATP
jgi:hypothetical protein